MRNSFKEGNVHTLDIKADQSLYFDEHPKHNFDLTQQWLRTFLVVNPQSDKALPLQLSVQLQHWARFLYLWNNATNTSPMIPETWSWAFHAPFGLAAAVDPAALLWLLSLGMHLYSAALWPPIHNPIIVFYLYFFYIFSTGDDMLLNRCHYIDLRQLRSIESA